VFGPHFEEQPGATFYQENFIFGVVDLTVTPSKLYALLYFVKNSLKPRSKRHLITDLINVYSTRLQYGTSLQYGTRIVHVV
jgi:hypothetical protein